MRMWLSVLLALLVLALSPWASAQPAPNEGGGQLVASPRVVALAPAGDSFRGRLTLDNSGTAPLRIERIVPADLPAGLGLDPVGSGTVLAPGQRLAIEVIWVPEASRARQLVGHLVVTSDAPGDALRVGVVAEAGFAPDRIALSLLVWLPLLGLLSLWLRPARLISFAAQAAGALVAGYVAARFSPGFGALDGHGGYQLVERRALLGGAEYHLGIDGIALALVVAAALVFLVAAGGAMAARQRAALHLGATAVMGALVAVDAALFLFFWTLAWMAAVLAVSAHGRPGAGRLALVALLATALVSVGLSQLIAHGTAGYHLDGTPIDRSLSFVALRGVSWLERARSTVTTSFVLIIGGCVLGALAGVRGFLRDGASDRHLVWVGGLGIYGVIRLGLDLMPEASRWAAPILAGLAAVLVVFFALRALVAEADGELSASASLAHHGLALLAVSGLTPIGIEAAVILLVGNALARALVGRVPRVLSLALSSGAALPWGPLLAFVAAGARHPAATIVAALGWMILIAAHVRAHRFLTREPEPLSRALVTLLLLSAAMVAVYPRPLGWWLDQAALDRHRRLDPPDGAQIAALTSAGASAPSSVACAPRAVRAPSG